MTAEEQRALLAVALLAAFADGDKSDVEREEVKRIAATLGIALAAWLVLAYGVLPLVWTEIERGPHPALDGLSHDTRPQHGAGRMLR